MRILIFGDSIVEGLGDNDKGGWVNRLKLDFWNKKDDVEITNCGIIGDNTINLLNRYESFKKAYNEKYQDKTIIIFSIGVNDSYVLENTDNQIDLMQFEENIMKLIELSNKDMLVSKIFFLTIFNVDESKTCPVSWKNIYYKNLEIKNYNSVIKDLCLEKGIEYLDLFGTIDNSDFVDGLHPNSNGHEKIYKEVKAFLEENIIL